MLRRLLRRANDAAPELLSPTLVDRGYARGERILVDGRQATGRLTGIATPNGVKNATTDLALIGEWRRRLPRHNIGVACAGF